MSRPQRALNDQPQGNARQPHRQEEDGKDQLSRKTPSPTGLENGNLTRSGKINIPTGRKIEAGHGFDSKSMANHCSSIVAEHSVKNS